MMLSFLFAIILLVAGFFAGHSLGVRQGYDEAMAHVNHVIDRLEKLYRERLERLEKIIRERLINKV